MEGTGVDLKAPGPAQQKSQNKYLMASASQFIHMVPTDLLKSAARDFHAYIFSGHQ
jgi:hypothetical protein